MSEALRERARERARQLAQQRREQKVAEAQGLSCRVEVQDLESLDRVKTLLSALNDAYIGAADVRRLVEDIPVLRARCIRRAIQPDEEEQPDLGEALRRIGNMGLETELLGVLEDLTMLHAELEEEL